VHRSRGLQDHTGRGQPGESSSNRRAISFTASESGPGCGTKTASR